MRTRIIKTLNDTVTVKLRGKWQNISLRTFDRMLFKDMLSWDESEGCFVGITG